MTKAFTALTTFLTLSPLFLLTVGGWIGAMLFICAGLALIALAVGYRRGLPLAAEQKTWLWAMAITFTLPVVAVLLGQLFRHEIVGRYYDSPLRFLLSAPIMIVLARQRFDVLRPMLRMLPPALLIALIVVTLYPDAGWGGKAHTQANYSRISTYFIDPITFGSLCLALGLCCLLSIDLYRRDAWGTRLVKGAGFLIGFYLSVISGSRTGWLALPLVLLAWVQVKMVGYRLAMLLVLSCFLGGSYYLSDTLQQRLHLAVQEVLSYRWDAVNPVSSVGDRLSFLRMAIFLFEQNPLGGFGDKGFEAWINHPELNRYALVKTQQFALRSGFHNEIATNMVRSGIWGLLASLTLFLAPLAFFLAKLRSASAQVVNIALLGLGYLLCTLVSAMTTEVFNLKFTASFHALMFACLISSVLVHSTSNRNLNS